MKVFIITCTIYKTIAKDTFFLLFITTTYSMTIRVYEITSALSNASHTTDAIITNPSQDPSGRQTWKVNHELVVKETNKTGSALTHSQSMTNTTTK